MLANESKPKVKVTKRRTAVLARADADLQERYPYGYFHFSKYK